MSTALATLAGKLAERVGMDSVDPQELITTLRQTAFKGDASDAQFIALLIVANQYGLNPWTKEIYAFPDKQNGIVPVVGVDGWSRIINENQQFDGMDFEQDNESCTCRIYRKDRNHPICVTEWMDECRREPFKTREGREITGPWQSHPKRMLRHKAMISVPAWPSDLLVSMTRMKPSALSKIPHTLQNASRNATSLRLTMKTCRRLTLC
ncbi:bacteriophage recombination protein [Escherichia coli]|uniref:Bacteriophage recombination protein n=1 Tax=Escherichia coli TaxID=562 RepID=A0A376W229_ECOLX|nr:bacteriophage recombination protein [Escherichia coli]